MGRIYNLLGENMGLGTGVVLASLATSGTVLVAGSRIKIRRVEISQSAAGTTAMVRAALSTRNAAGTLTVTAATPTPVDTGAPASAITAASTAGATVLNAGINSSADSGGAYTDKWNAAFSNLNGWLWIPAPGEEITVNPAQVFTARLLAAPASTTGWNVAVCYEEV